MLCPTQLIGRAQSMSIIVAIARVIAVSAPEQAQSAEPAAWPEARREGIEPAVTGARRVRDATFVRAQKDARPVLLRERHQRMPSFMIE